MASLIVLKCANGSRVPPPKAARVESGARHIAYGSFGLRRTKSLLPLSSSFIFAFAIPQYRLQCTKCAVNARKVYLMLVGGAMANTPQTFRQHQITRALKAAAAAGVKDPHVKIHLPNGTVFHVGGGAPPKKSMQKGVTLAEGGSDKMH